MRAEKTFDFAPPLSYLFFCFFSVLRSAAWNEEVCYFSVVHELTVQERTLLNGQEGTRHEEAARVHKAMNQTLNFERIFLKKCNHKLRKFLQAGQ